MSEEDNRTLWVGNLSEDIYEELLYELFLQAGPLEKVFLPKDKNGSGRTRGYAFVCFHHEVSVPYAYNLMNGINLCGRPLRLQYRTGSSHDTPSKSSQPQTFQNPESEVKDPPKHIKDNILNTPSHFLQQQQQSMILEKQQLIAVQQHINKRSFDTNFNNRNNFSPGMMNISSKDKSTSWDNNSLLNVEIFNNVRSVKEMSFSNHSPYQEREIQHDFRSRNYNNNNNSRLESQNYRDRENIRDRRDYNSQNERNNYLERESVRDHRDYNRQNGNDYRRSTGRYSNYSRNVR